MPRLVAIDLAGQRAVESVRAVWDQGDAVLVVDQRLADTLRRALVTDMGASEVIDVDGRHSRDNGRPVDDGDAVVVATSGSTGTPKGVVLTHSALAASADMVADRIGSTSADVWLACLPLSHIGGFGVVARAWHQHASLIVHERPTAAAVEDGLARGATRTSLVATVLNRVDTSAFRTVIVGGSQPPPFPAPNVVTTYGLTESCGGVVYDGRPLASVEVRVADDDEIWLRSPTLMRGYRDGTTSIDTDGWLHTDDIGAFRDGKLFVVGRRGDMIVTGGENVWPVPVTAAILGHPSVDDAVVAGVADATWGQRVVAWVVVKPDAPGVSLGDLRDHVSATLPRFMAPAELRVVAHIPRTALGKVRLRELP